MMNSTGKRRYAVMANGQFAELAAGITRRQPTLEQTARTSYYFGTGQTGRRQQSQSASRIFSGVWVPGNPAQTAVMDAAEAGEALDFLCWQDGLPQSHTQRRGNGFMGRAVPALESDGTSAAGGAEGISFTLTECGGRRVGTVYAEADGIRFAPLVGAAAGVGL